HHGLERAVPARQPPDEAAQLGLAFGGDRARVHDGEVGRGGGVHHHGALVGKRLPHQFRVVLVRPAAESVEEDVHGRTATPTSTLQTRSRSPPPVRASRSTPRSISARPCESARPTPAATANSVGGLVPGPKGTWPPRTPNRSAEAPPPNAPGPARDHDRHATAAARRALRLGSNCTPPPAMRGRSVSATVVSATTARK